MTAPAKDPRRQWQGKVNKARGKQFEERLDAAFEYYKTRGSAVVEKTPEPMKPIRSLGKGQFVACYERKAQPDYKGVIKGGRAVMFEAKFTSTDRMEQDRVRPEQGDYLDRHQALGARCYVLAGFLSGAVYLLPWDDWKSMKQRFGRKYATEADLKPYRVPLDRAGRLLVLG
ncbi:MAG: Holliday junction resolvase RecU [Roseburia sp.]|nr:Holliday junction resolvase RecU [Roseburia sp.]